MGKIKSKGAVYKAGSGKKYIYYGAVCKSGSGKDKI